MAADIVKQGYVKFKSNNLGKSLGVWNRKWLMLRRQSCKGPVRLEKYKDESTASVMSIYGADKKIIDLTRMDRIERLPESVKKHSISILVDVSHSIQFAVGSEMEAESWLNAIRDEIHPENRQTHESFDVYMQPSDYMTTPGDCTLQLTRGSLKLLERYGGRELTHWPWSGIRRFGVERNMFTFEAGSSCPSGSGTYFFSGGDSEFIYQRVQTLSQASPRTNSSEGSMQSSFSMSGWGNIASISELSDQRQAGVSGGGRATDQENPYNIDVSMPTDRPPVRSNSSFRQRSSGPSTGGQGHGGHEGEYAYSELPVNNQRNAIGGRLPSSRSNAGDASTSSSMQVHGVNGQYYAVPRTNNTNHQATNLEQRTTLTNNQASDNGVRLPSSRSNAANASTSSSMQVRGVDGPYYAVSRNNVTNQHAANQEQRTALTSQTPANGNRRLPMEGSRGVNGPAGPPQDTARDSARSAANGRIRAVALGGDYYAVTRGNNPNTHQGGSPDLIQFDQTSEQTRAHSGRMSGNSSAAGHRARTRGEESPYYAASETYGSADQDDDDEVYSVPPVLPGGPRTVRR